MYIDLKNRVKMTLSMFIVFFMLISMRILYITTIWSGELSVMSEEQYIIEEKTRDINYALKDSKGTELLNFNLKYYFVVDTNSFLKNNKDTDLSAINSIIYILRNYKKEYDLSEIQNTNKRVYYEIDEITYKKIGEIKDVKGVYVFKKSEVDRTNYWRYENLLSNTLDSKNDLKEKDSIENEIYNKTKDNEYESIIFEKDLSGNILQSGQTNVDKNINVNLTTDRTLENNIKQILLKENYKNYEQIGVIISEPTTGKILAMVQRDDNKPNVNLGAATENGYEPGSIFKTVVEETAIDGMGISVNYKYNCNESKKYHGNINMEEAYIVSCNDYYRNLGNKLKFDNILLFAKKQGLFSKVLNFSGNEEVAGDYSNEEYQDGNLAIGQSMRITPIQAIGIVNTIVNKGVYIKPYLINGYTDNEGNVLEKKESPATSVISSGTAKFIKNEMIKVVTSEKGTARKTNIQGLEIGGKTGTTERVETTKTESGELIKTDCSDGWFIGFIKIKNKYVTAVIFVKNIKVEGEEAGNTAVPIFKEVVNIIK